MVPMSLLIVLATGNEHKVEELRQLAELHTLPLTLHSAKPYGGMPQVDENGSTYEENALIKAEALRPFAPPHAYVLADDSGLAVDALNGAPGIHSARYAGPQADPAANNRKLLTQITSIPNDNRKAHFTCVLTLLAPSYDHVHFKGELHGHLISDPAGNHGFGYDPLFVPNGYRQTLAELPPPEKNRLSHRANAFSKLAQFLKERLNEK